MKKLLIMLMVVAMAAFLFVGCLPGVTPAEEEVPEEEVPVVAKTDTPYITNIGESPANISLSSTKTQYTNSPEVKGVGVAGAVIKVYIDGVQSGVGSTGTGGGFDYIPVSMITLTEGVRKLYVTATQPGLTESDKSTEYTFTYDETEPSIASVVADSGDNTIKVTFDGDVEMATSGTKYATSAMNPTNWAWYESKTLLTLTTLSSTNCTISYVSDKCVKITPDATMPVPTAAGGAGYFYITCLANEGEGEDSIIDKAGNYLTVDVTYSGLSIP